MPVKKKSSRIYFLWAMIIGADKILINHWFDLKFFLNEVGIGQKFQQTWSIYFMKYNRFQCITVEKTEQKH